MSRNVMDNEVSDQLSSNPNTESGRMKIAYEGDFTNKCCLFIVVVEISYIF